MPVEFSPAFREERWAYKRKADKKLKFAILAAGLGSRMDPLTARHLPKPLFPLGGKLAMAEVWVRRAVESGVTDISMNLCVLADTIKRYFRDGLKFGANITYVEEEVPSGTLGGVCKMALGGKSKVLPCQRGPVTTDPFEGSTVVVPSGDIVTNFGAGLLEEMYDIHRKEGAALSMALVPVPWERRKDYGTAILSKPEVRKGHISKSGRVESFIEKDANSPSNLSNASIYMIEMELLKALDPLRTAASVDAPDPFYDFGKHVFPAMLGKLPHVSLPTDFLLWGMEYDGSWFDVGQKRDYIRVNECLLDGKLHLPLPYEELPWGYLGTDVRIDFSMVKIKPPVVIGNRCVIERDAVLGPYAVIGDDWTIQRQARIEHSVLWQRYSYFDDEGNEVPAEDWELIDRHTVRKGVVIEESIVAGGDIEKDLREKTVDVQSNGEQRDLPIDYMASGPRP